MELITPEVIAAHNLTPEEFAKNVGFNGVLQKPYTADELWRVVKSVLPNERT